MKDVKEVLKIGVLVVVIGAIIGGLLFWVDQNRTKEIENEQASRAQEQEYSQSDRLASPLLYPAPAFPLSGSLPSLDTPYRQSLPGLSPVFPYSTGRQPELSERVPMIYRRYHYQPFATGQMAQSGISAPATDNSQF